MNDKLDYVVYQTRYRMDSWGMTHAEALLDTLAKHDPDLYTKVLGDKRWTNLRLWGSVDLLTFYNYLGEHYGTEEISEV